MFSELKSKAGGFPIPSSLFCKINGKYVGTWGYLERGMASMVDSMLNKQVEYGSRLFTFMCFNMVDPKNCVNPFAGNPTAAEIIKRVYAMQDPGYDWAEVDRWVNLIKIGAIPGVFFVPTIFCGDDRATTRNEAFVNWYSPIIIRTLYPYVAGYNIVSEATKSMDRERQERMVTVCKAAFDIEPKLAPKPIFVHCAGTDIARNADGLMYEFSKNPWDAKQYSVNEVVNEARAALRNYEKMIWLQELAVECEESWARDMVRGLRDLARTESRIIGLPGPM